MDITIRPEREEDYNTVGLLTRDAFWNLYLPGCDEHYLVNIMREDPDFIRDLAYVAEVDGRIVGSILYTKSFVIDENNRKLDTVTFGPLCVHPDVQRRGIGSSLIEFTKQIVMQKGYPAIIILGDPHNYCKHGFKTGKDYGISNSEGEYPLCLLVLELQKGIFGDHKWVFRESTVFTFERNNVEEYDKRFPPKVKEHVYSQDLFSMLVRSYVK